MSIFKNNDNTLVDEHFVSYIWQEEGTRYLEKMTSLSIKIVFLSGSLFSVLNVKLYISSISNYFCAFTAFILLPNIFFSNS